MKKNRETRSLDFNHIDLQIREEDGKKKIRGYAAVFDSPSNNALWQHRKEILGRSAFDKTLKENKDIKALYNHNTGEVLGSVRAETLTLNTDENGLYFEITPSVEERSYERDLRISLERGDVSGCSFGFYPIKYHDETRNEKEYRIIDEVQLFEISVVPFPAYGDTEVGYRNEEKTEEKNTISSDSEQEPESTLEEPEATPSQPDNSTDKMRSFMQSQITLLGLG